MASAELIRSASSRRGHNNRSIANDSAAADEEDEEVPLLGGRSLSGLEDRQPLPYQPWASNPFHDLPVYMNIWKIRKMIVSAIQDPYSLEQFRAPRLNTSLVRPMLVKLYEQQDISVVFCLLVNRLRFLRDQVYQAHDQSVNTSRARLCEILALRLLRQFDDDSQGLEGLLLLSNIIIAGFHPFQNAPEGILNGDSHNRHHPNVEDARKKQLTALEVAILSESKLFLSSPACQSVVDAIYCGRIVYTPNSFIDILADHYKRRPISIYNPRKAPVLNQYRLSVPRIRNVIEVFHFIILLVLYIVVMTTHRTAEFSFAEVVFCIYSFGWILDQLASILEHGWTVYSQNLWSYLDVTFSVIYLVYFSLRMHNISTGSHVTARPAFDVLAMASPFLIPRLGFNLFSENLVFVALREMMARFMLLTLLAFWTFAGFLMAMLWLDENQVGATTIGKWMIWVWFGLDGTGIQEAVKFHRVLGPTLMISFAILGNTLFLTIVVSTLGNAFNQISKDSFAEVQFRRAVLTFEAVKSDAIFAFPPPFNIVALFVMLPLKAFLSPRWFHKVHIISVRMINAPLLVLISLYDRFTLWPSMRGDHKFFKYAKRVFRGDFTNFHVHGDIQTVFDHPPPRSKTNSGDDLNPIKQGTTQNAFDRKASPEYLNRNGSGKGRSGDSSHSMAGGDVDARLKKIEELLSRVCESMEGDEDNNE